METIFETVRIEIKFPIRFHKYAVRIPILEIPDGNLHSTVSTQRLASTKIVSSLQSCHVWIRHSQCIAIQFRQPSLESLSYSHGRTVSIRDSTAFSRITFPELHRGEGVLGKPARHTEIQIRVGRLNKGGEDGKRFGVHLVHSPPTKYIYIHVFTEVRGIPNPVTS